MLGFVSLRPVTPRRPGARIALSAMSAGEEAVVREVGGPEGFQDRLHAIGLSPGAAVRLLRIGCPVVVHLEGGRFSLRREDAARIVVEPQVPEAA